MNTIQQDLEHTLAYHGAPALAGIKSADLVAWGSAEQCQAPFFQAYCRQLARRGIQLRVLWTGSPRCLLLVYRPRQLERQLADAGVRSLLQREGYPVEDGLEAMLSTLTRRLAGGSFPHEVGLFLGYPPEDVEGFRIHRGRNCKLSGCWKVYSDVERARQCFRRYGLCRAALCRRIQSGTPLAQVFRVA